MDQDTRQTILADPRFFRTLSKVPVKFATLLESYSGIPQAEQVKHITTLRDQALTAHPYPCLGRFRFLDLDLSKHPLYDTVLLPLLKAPADSGVEPLFLDFGTCLGQDIRQLISDGVSPTRLYGSDIEPAFIDLGYELFRDESKFPRSHFLVPADAFNDTPSNPLTQLDGRVTVLHISAVFHLFDLDKQEPLAQRCLKLLSQTAPGGRCLVLGAQTANVVAGDYKRVTGRSRWRHNAESWREMWEEAARVHGGCKVEVESVLHDGAEAIKGRVQEGGSGAGAVAAEDGEPSKVIGLQEEGFRWCVFWIWVEFETAGR